MFKKQALWGALFCVGLSLAAAPSSKNDQKIVAWDLHGVLFSQPGKHGWKCRPDKQMCEVVKSLHAQGVKQVIFSNISRQSFSKLQFLYPEVFRYFDLNESMVNAQGIFTRKPHAKYITKFLKKTKKSPKNILFFDDKSNNIAGAKAYGIDAHVFKNKAETIALLQQKNVL